MYVIQDNIFVIKYNLHQTLFYSESYILHGSLICIRLLYTTGVYVLSFAL